MLFTREIVSAFRLGMASHWARPRHLLLIAGGFVISTWTLLLMLAIPAGLDRLGEQTGFDDVAIVFAASAQDEASSALDPGVAALVGDLPGIARDNDGQPVIAPQFIANAKLRRRDGNMASVLMRGVTPATWKLVESKVHQDESSPPERGVNELSAGAAASRTFVALDPGAQVKVRDSVWRISGRFNGGGIWESELWTDIAPLQSTFNTPSALSVLWVKLQRADALSTFEKAFDADKRLQGLRVERQADYYMRQVRFVSHFVGIATAAIAAALGLDAMLAIGNAMTLALIARRRELATLRVLGYRRSRLAVSLFLEVLLIGVVATAMTVGVARLNLDGLQIGSSTGNQAIGFELAVTLPVVAWTFVYAIILGMASAIWPASDAVRAPLVATLGGD